MGDALTVAADHLRHLFVVSRNESGDGRRTRREETILDGMAGDAGVVGDHEYDVGADARGSFDFVATGAEGVVTNDGDGLLVGPSQLCADRVRDAGTNAASRTSVEAEARVVAGEQHAGHGHGELAVGGDAGTAINGVAEITEEAMVVNGDTIRVHGLGSGGFILAAGLLQRGGPPALSIRRRALGERVGQGGGGSGTVCDDAKFDVGTAVHLFGDNVDLHDADARSVFRGVAELEDPVEAGAHGEKNIGLREGSGTGGVDAHGMVVRDCATTGGRGDEGNAEIDEALDLRASIGPGGTFANEDKGALGSGEHAGDGVDGAGIRLGRGKGRRCSAEADALLGDLLGDQLTGKVKINGSRAASHSVAECEVHVLGDAADAIDLEGPLAGGCGVGNLVDLLESAKAASRAAR